MTAEVKKFFKKALVKRSENHEGFITDADAIQLMQDYANHVLEDRWISVEDRLPEKKCQVLAINDGNVVISNYEVKHWLLYIQGTALLFQPILSKVTHWQPLPKPKK